MPELTEISLLRDLNVAQRVRIAELELELLNAGESLRRAQKVIREVLDGSGASLEEKLHASVALAETSAILATALQHPKPVPGTDAFPANVHPMRRMGMAVKPPRNLLVDEPERDPS